MTWKQYCGGNNFHKNKNGSETDGYETDGYETDGSCLSFVDVCDNSDAHNVQHFYESSV